MGFQFKEFSWCLCMEWNSWWVNELKRCLVNSLALSSSSSALDLLSPQRRWEIGMILGILKWYSVGNYHYKPWRRIGRNWWIRWSIFTLIFYDCYRNSNQLDVWNIYVIICYILFKDIVWSILSDGIWQKRFQITGPRTRVGRIRELITFGKSLDRSEESTRPIMELLRRNQSGWWNKGCQNQ